MKPHDPFVVDDEADDCPPPLPVVAQDGEAEEEDDDGKPQDVGCTLIFCIVLILLVALSWGPFGGWFVMPAVTANLNPLDPGS